MEYPIEVAGTPLQVTAAAVSANGDVTFDPFAGLAMTMLGPVGATTVMFNRVWLLVFLPQHLTWRTCEPVEAVTQAVKEVGSMVEAPLSME
jgi:hypothetical protein